MPGSRGAPLDGVGENGSLATVLCEDAVGNECGVAIDPMSKDDVQNYKEERVVDSLRCGGSRTKRVGSLRSTCVQWAVISCRLQSSGGYIRAYGRREGRGPCSPRGNKEE